LQKDGPHCPEELLSEQFFCIRLTNGDIQVRRLKWTTVYMEKGLGNNKQYGFKTGKSTEELTQYRILKIVSTQQQKST